MAAYIAITGQPDSALIRPAYSLFVPIIHHAAALMPITHHTAAHSVHHAAMMFSFCGFHFILGQFAIAIGVRIFEIRRVECLDFIKRDLAVLVGVETPGKARKMLVLFGAASWRRDVPSVQRRK